MTVEQWMASTPTVVEVTSAGVGPRGEKGDAGQSAYAAAVSAGFTGTQAEWLASLVGPQGPKGDTGQSAYAAAVSAGFTGTQAEWLASLVGPQGPKGDRGEVGPQGLTGDAGAQGLKGDKGDRGEPGPPGTVGSIDVVPGLQAALDAKAEGTDPRLSDARAPTGPAGGVLSGTYPNPGFAVEMATKEQLDAVDFAKVDTVPGKGLSTEDFTTAHKVKLDGTADGATANSTDAQLRDRATHTGTQAIETVAGLQAALDSKQARLVSGENLKTLNGESLLGSGNIIVQSGAAVALSGDPAPYVTQTKTYQITNYNSFSDYVVQVSAGVVSLSGDTITYTAPATAGSVSLTLTVDGAPTVFAVNVQPAGVATPANSTPINGATDQNGTVTLISSAFAWYGLSDTHLNSDWQLATDAGFTNIVQSANADATDKTSWTVSGLSTSQTYYWRVRHRGTNNGVSSWSAGTSFVTRATFGGLIGIQGGQGFGVGEYSETLPSGFSAMTGTSDKASANYGNYQYSDGSIIVFVPRFYYRIGNAASPRYATYGANAIDIVGIDTYATEAAANAAGYALHRAFKDGGAVKSGFFIDKYLASKNGTTGCKSIAAADPISLTTSAGYNPSSGMAGCTGILADAVVLARARGAGVFNVASIFMYDALAKLALAHGQAATGAAPCAWYDASGVTNFPKGCNNGALADTNDASVTYAVSTTSPKPKTRATANFAKTTHNGQECGVADINGSMYQVLLGLTMAGTSATDSSANGTGNAYVLKESAMLASLTGGFGGTTDAWGTTTSLANNFDLLAGFLPWTSTTGWDYFGSGGSQVFSGATSGADYLRSCVGIGATTGMSATGTNQFGNDGNYRYGVANLFPMASGNWLNAAVAGVFYRLWNFYRSDDSNYVGFRAAAYGN